VIEVVIEVVIIGLRRRVPCLRRGRGLGRGQRQEVRIVADGCIGGGGAALSIVRHFKRAGERDKDLLPSEWRRLCCCLKDGAEGNEAMQKQYSAQTQ
jgi:hypothetical protein